MPINEFLRRLSKNKRVLYLVVVLCAILTLGLYAPFFASSKSLVVFSERGLQFPLFKNLLYRGFYTQKLDLFYNVLMVTLPLYLFGLYLFRRKKVPLTLFFIVLQLALFYNCVQKPLKNVEVYPEDLKAEFNGQIDYAIRPLLVQKHWQENAIDPTSSSFFSTVRVNGKSLWSSLLFGIRYSVSVAVLSTCFAFLLGIIMGSLAGYFGKKIDLILGRVIEVWESMPTLFVLLMIISLSGRQTMGFIIAVLTLFSWTPIARIVRLEVLKQKSLAYVDVLKGFGFGIFYPVWHPRF